MKKLLLLILAWGEVSFAGWATSYVGLTAGALADQFGGALPANSLLILLASGTDTTFTSSLTAGQFVSGDDVALAFASVNNNLGGIQMTSNAFTLSIGLAGQPLAIRWFSNFTYQQSVNGETPGAGSHFGTFAGLTSGSPNNGQPWVLPSDGGTITINFATENASSAQSLHFNDAYAPRDGHNAASGGFSRR